MFYDPNDVVGQGISAWGFYEADVLSVLGRYIAGLPRLGSREIGIDVGANIGNHTLALRPLFDHTYAVEPNPIALHILYANLLRNNVKDVTVLEFAATAVKSELLLELNRDNLGATKISSTGSVVVQGDSIDDLIMGHLGPDDWVKFIKLDVEGHEAKALEGATQILKKFRPVLAFEAHDGTLESVLNVISPLGYTNLKEVIYPGWRPSDNFGAKLMGLARHGPKAELQDFDHNVEQFRELVVATVP